MVLEEKERTCCSSCSKTDKLTSIYISIIGPIGHGKGILYHNCSLLPFPRKCKWSSLCWIMTSWGRTKPSVRSLWVTMPPAQSWGTGLICWPTLVAPLPSGTLWNLKRRWTPLLGRTNRQLHLPASPPEHSKWSRAIDTSVRQRFVFCSALFCFFKTAIPFFGWLSRNSGWTQELPWYKDTDAPFAFMCHFVFCMSTASPSISLQAQAQGKLLFLGFPLKISWIAAAVAHASFWLSLGFASFDQTLGLC